jgi:hypothetical protein
VLREETDELLPAGLFQTEQPKALKIGVGPSDVVASSSASLACVPLAQDTALSASDPLVDFSQLSVVGMMEIAMHAS